MTARYRYVFADLVSDRTIDELDLADVKFDRRICQAGAFSATLPVPNRAMADRAARVVPRLDGDLSTGPGRTVMHVYRAGALWGSYIIWSATPESDDRGRVSIGLRGASLESWLWHREIRTDITYDQTDQLEIARSLVFFAQEIPGQAGVSGADIGITFPLPPPESGILRDREYKASEAETYGKRLEQLSEVIDGPEWAIRTYTDASGERVREFVAEQQLGQGSTDHVFSQPGNIIAWSYPADATDAATSWQARGDTPNDDVAADSEPLLSDFWYSTRHLDSGWPLLERTEDYQSVTDIGTLNGYARWWASRRSGMVRIPQVTVRLDEHTSFSPNRIGDYARLTLVNHWFPPLPDGSPTFRRTWRVIGVEVTPTSRADGQERAKLIFEEPTDQPAGSLTGVTRA
ncbi:hypothetical protein GCM10009799_20670 [Nocardiopsis rhodophaea]|uniref:Uncharacterized protein n=1 Tax=Nocardiopsis rhodophaea TaxID=280238 RepID=A0ABN2SYQ6_9ACTN